MTELHIPLEAENAGADALQGYQIAESDLIDAAAEVLQAAAPLVVADAFRRFADDNRGKWNTAARVMIALRAEADKLDGGTS